MATQAYICRVRTDLPAGAVQITDLQPNTSQRSYVYQPVGQSGYCPPLYQDDTVAVAANVTVAEYNGLAAWAIAAIEDSGDGGALTAGEANQVADAIFAAAQTAISGGTDLDTAAVNAAIGPVVAASGIGLGNSVGTLVQVLRILSGEVFTLPAGSAADSGAGNYVAALKGSFDDSDSEARGFRKIFSTGALQISCGAGVLNGLGASTFSYYVSGAAVTGAAVAVFAADGTLLNG